MKLVRGARTASVVPVPKERALTPCKSQPPATSRQGMKSTATRGFRSKEAQHDLRPQKAWRLYVRLAGPALCHAGLLVAHGVSTAAQLQGVPALVSGLTHLAALVIVLLVGFLGAWFPWVRLPPTLATLLHLGVVVSTLELESGFGDRFAQMCAAAACLQAAATCLYPASGPTWFVQSWLLFLGLLVEGLLLLLSPLELLGSLLLPFLVTMAIALAAGSPMPQTRGALMWEMLFGQLRNSEELSLRAALQPFLEQQGSKASLQERAQLTMQSLSEAPLRPMLAGVLCELMTILQKKPMVRSPDSQMSVQLAQASPMVREFVQQVLTPMCSGHSEGGLPMAASSPRNAPRPSKSLSSSTPNELESFLALLLAPPVKTCLEPRPPPAHAVSQLLNAGLGKWHLDLFRLCEASDDRPLVHLAMAGTHELATMLELPTATFANFFDSVEALYKPKLPYHNSIHAADVLNNMLFFLKLHSTPFSGIFDPIDQLAALVSAAAHDVGHGGLNNRFQVMAQTPSAQVFNDQHCLENMHCALTFAVLRNADADFTEELCEASQQQFRATVVMMILETDLAVHQESVRSFKQGFLEEGVNLVTDLGKRRRLLSYLLKTCDVGGGTKPFVLHTQWATRIATEFFRQGDTEKELGLPCSPFCDRSDTKISESQQGFFQFIVSPLFTTLNSFMLSRRVDAELLAAMEENRSFWQRFGMGQFNYQDPMASIPDLQQIFNRSQS